MFRSYLTTAWRNIIRHKAYSIINVLGLALGICACIVIFIITSYEFSFDKFHPGKERIYRVMGDVTESGGEKSHFDKLPMPISLTARATIPDRCNSRHKSL